MKNIKNSTATALLSISIGLGMSGVIVNMPTTSTSAKNNVANIYSYVNVIQNRNSYIGQNRNITMNNDSRDILTQKNLVELKNCINNEPAEFGEEISYIGFFYLLRIQDNYKDIISQINLLPKRFQLSLAVLLSHINTHEIKDIEKSFIIDLLHEDLLSCQEYALNTISIWNAAELLPYIDDVQIDNIFLQRRFNKIISRFKEII